MAKKCNSYELLIRIDERVKVLPTMRQDIREIKDTQRDHDYRIKTLEKTGGGFNIIRLIRSILRL